MNKVYQMWYLLFIYYDFATVVNPFFRAVLLVGVRIQQSLKALMNQGNT